MSGGKDLALKSVDEVYNLMKLIENRLGVVIAEHHADKLKIKKLEVRVAAKEDALRNLAAFAKEPYWKDRIEEAISI